MKKNKEILGLAFVFAAMYLVFEVICPRYCKPMTFEDHRARFKARMLAQWVESGTNMGLYAPLRIIFARDALLSAAAASGDPQAMARAAMITEKVNHYLLANSNRSDWENFHQPKEALEDAMISRANKVPQAFRDQDAAVLEGLLLESLRV